MYCPRCAARIKRGATACGKCGLVFTRPGQAPPPRDAVSPASEIREYYGNKQQAQQPRQPAPPQSPGTPHRQYAPPGPPGSQQQYGPPQQQGSPPQPPRPQHAGGYRPFPYGPGHSAANTPGAPGPVPPYRQPPYPYPAAPMKKPLAGRWWFWVLVVLAAFVVLVFVVGSLSPDEPAGPVSPQGGQAAQALPLQEEAGHAAPAPEDLLPSYGDTVVFKELEIVFGDSLEWSAVDNQFSDYHEHEVFLVPITITNTSAETHGLSFLEYTQYGPDGVKLHNISSYFSDDYETKLRSGGAIRSQMPFLYRGDGDYYVEFEQLLGTDLEVRLPVYRQGAPAGPAAGPDATLNCTVGEFVQRANANIAQTSSALRFGDVRDNAGAPYIQLGDEITILLEEDAGSGKLKNLYIHAEHEDSIVESLHVMSAVMRTVHPEIGLAQSAELMKEMVEQATEELGTQTYHTYGNVVFALTCEDLRTFRLLVIPVESVQQS